MTTKEERILEWARQQAEVEMVAALIKTFRGLVLTNEDDTLTVMKAVDELLGRLTGIGDLTGTGLGLSATGYPSGRKYTNE